MNNGTRSDVIVIGAGAIGASSAFHLARAGRGVTVLEAFPGPAEGSTGRSFACVRVQWADPVNIAMTWRSIRDYYQVFESVFGIDVGYFPRGYLLLVPEREWDDHLAVVELQRQHGAPVEVLDVPSAQQVTPFTPDGVGGATLGAADGVVDPHLVTTAFLGLARNAGARVLFNSPVTAIERNADGEWTVTSGDRRFHAQHVVNAAGGWSGEVAALAGLDVPVCHLRRNIYSTAPGALPDSLPMTVDVETGVFLRSEGDRLLFGLSRPDEVPGYRTTVDWPWMESVLFSAVDRFPWLTDLPLDRTGCWAGTYEVTPDHQGILGPDSRAQTWINACGFSGHGLMQSPEIGRLVAEQVTTGAISEPDIRTGLSIDRFAAVSDPHAVPDLVF